MPLFFFHMRGPDGLSEDPEGTDFPNIDTAREEALIAGYEMLADQLKAGRRIGKQQFEICGDDGELLAIVPFSTD